MCFQLVFSSSDDVAWYQRAGGRGEEAAENPPIQTGRNGRKIF